MGSIQFDKPRSITPEAICRELRESKDCAGLEILLWDEEITVEDRKSGAELTIKLETSKVELLSEAGQKVLAERVAGALIRVGLRRRGIPGQPKPKRIFRRSGAPPSAPMDDADGAPPSPAAAPSPSPSPPTTPTKPKK